MNQDQVITLIISELSKDSRLRQVVQHIAVKASGGIVKQEPPNFPVPTIPQQREEVKQMNNWPTYTEMVRNLFKHDDSKTNMVMHAAIGLAGESGEMRAAKDYKEACEEAGDMIFYLEALRQQLPPNHGNVELLTEVTSSPYYRPSHATVVDNIHIITCEILDVAKKSWVYGREIDSFKLGWMIELLQIQLDYYCTEYLGLTVPGVKYQNQAKLMVRYEGGKYSNEAAIARKDKQ